MWTEIDDEHTYNCCVAMASPIIQLASSLIIMHARAQWHDNIIYVRNIY